MFPERLKQLRIEAGLTQKELAENAGLRQSHISSWESGSRTPLIDGLIKISRYFGCSVDYLIGLSDEKIFRNDDISSIINYAKLNLKGKSLVDGYIKGLLESSEFKKQ